MTAYLLRTPNPAHPDGCWCDACVRWVGPLEAVLIRAGAS